MWKDEPENIVGVLHTKDLLAALSNAGWDASKLDTGSVAAPPWFVPDTTSVADQLNEFLKRKAQLALVVDEYGEVQGLITLEDILEEIVGQITDEHDTQDAAVRVQADGSVNVDGTVAIRDLNRQMEWDLPDEEATTIAGLVIHEAQTIPEPGQAFTFYGYRFEILRKSRNKITAIRIKPVAGSGQARAPVRSKATPWKPGRSRATRNVRRQARRDKKIHAGFTCPYRIISWRVRCRMLAGPLHVVGENASLRQPRTTRRKAWS